MKHQTSPTISTFLDISQENKDLKASIEEKVKEYNKILDTIKSVEEDISEFQKVYDAKVKRLYEELDYLESLLFKYTNISEYVDDILSFSEAEKIFEQTMKDKRARMEDEFPGHARGNIFSEARSHLSKEDQAELKRLYRNLARKFHPDKTGGDDKMMKIINRAYQEGDLFVLRDLVAEEHADKRDDTFEGLVEQLHVLERLIVIAQRDLQALRKSDMFVLRKNLLKASKTNNERVLDRLSRELTKEIAAKKEKVQSYTEKFSQHEELTKEQTV